MNEYLYHIQPTRLAMLTEGAAPEEEELVSQHFAYLQGLLAQGKLILAGRTQHAGDDTFGVIIFRSESDEAARQIVENDPAVKGGVMRARLYPYRVALMEGRDDSD